MDVLAEEFGNLTPEQLAAPISTVEVRAGHAESGRGRERPQEALPVELAWRRGRGGGASAASAHAQRDGAGLFRSGPPSARGGAELGGAEQRPALAAFGWGGGGGP